MPRGWRKSVGERNGAAFLKGQTRQLTIPGSTRQVSYDPLQRTAVGISRLGTSEAVSIGAYAYALHMLG